MKENRMTIRGHLFTSGLVSLLAGCSNLADQNSTPPPLASIHGTLTLADGTLVPDGQLRLALLWATDEPYGSGSGDMGHCDQPYTKMVERSEQQVDIDATFPSQFTLNLTAPPPPEALIPLEENGEPAYGTATLVAYVDGNGNGRLDTRTAGEPAADTVLGSTEAYRYADHQPSDIREIEFNYHLEPYTFENTYEWPAGYSQFQYRAAMGQSGVVPIDTPIHMELTAAPALQDMLCEHMCRVEMPFDCPANPSDLPELPAHATQFRSATSDAVGWTWSDTGKDHHGVWHTCDSDGELFSWLHITCEDCSCRSAGCVYDRPAVPAADWPCDL
jgi:hypothetical protein